MVRSTHFYSCMISGFAAGLFILSPPAWATTAAEQGQTIAASGGAGIPACVACHGAQGEGMAAAGFPYLAGQGAAYLALQLQDFASGERGNPIMAPIAKALNPEQIKALAAYYGKLPAPFNKKALSGHIESYPKKEAVGAWIANRGDWNNNIPACIQCHGPGGVGVGDNFPAIAGLPAQYIRQQLLAWKEKKRPSGPLALMGEIANRMNDEQITAVADYFAALPGSVQNASPAKQGAK